MNLRQLHYFIEFAQALERGDAPSAWPHFKSHAGVIERELGTRLIEREGNATFRLTPAGVEYLAASKRMLQMHESAITQAASAARGQGGELRLGVCEEAVTNRLTHFLAAHKERYPATQVHLVEDSSSALVAALQRRELDLALILPVVDLSESLLTEVLWSDGWLAAMRSGHPLAEKDTLDCQDFTDQELLLGDPMWSSHGHDIIREAFRLQGMEPKIGALVFSRSTMLVLSAIGIGCTFVPASMIRNPHRPHPSNVLRPFRAPPLLITAVYLPDAPRIAIGFLELVRDIVGNESKTTGARES
ncbi:MULTISPECIES: LysR family substrate-binding domain-containing protein [unclassified Variovorax]|uniref:LysR family substrate-binding domain-containing protein n=1 Tax=unclassified Variovorax TaxID=663243 RepID=UPI003F44959D